METRNIIGISKQHNARRECKNLSMMSEIVAGVNAALNPDGPTINWFAPAEDAVAAVHIKNGSYEEALSNPDVVYGGTIDDHNINDLKVVAYNGNEGAIYAEGAGTDVTVDTAYISLAGDGDGIGGPASGASVKYNGRLTLKNVVINTTGRTRYATAAEEGSVLKVYDSVIWSHGIPFGEDYERPSALMSTPPPGLEIDGNTRTHCTMTNSASYFYNSKIICDGWAALSTEASDGYVYLEANDCDIVCTKDGYGNYADPGCHVRFNRCSFDMSRMTAILAGNSDMVFTDCDSTCGTYFVLSHCVNGWPEETSDLDIIGGRIRTKKEAILVKENNIVIHMNDVDIASECGILVHAKRSDDPCATPTDELAYGVNVILTDMDAKGDLIHEDDTREMWISLESTQLEGAIRGANLKMDIGSKWLATADSVVTLIGEMSPAQIDALEGVTIRAKGSQKATFDLASGGVLIVEP